ncbi:MAG: 50S ribosomal protein L13 [Candidatus Moranbacteria bacterium CG10_big_fil_rev_8_21_14_0_10_35_21]|nr:MAG: 50S ribosomal protein L13 [Candidatus Moranbacteria bacterium CG10_big_fil_rev_8_21_14_0_10_35_21]PJA88519.1 MAG: 50S ribosomal protein L13 [Candidatus Moranbacteria bacterium CG_4_9_14_3_um_filter_36_9]
MDEAKKKIERRFVLFDADGKILGRLSTEIATVLRGKNKVDFAPHIDAGDFAVVINADKITVTGNKMEGKIYHTFSGYPGGIRSIKLKDQLIKDSRMVIKDAVYGMLPKNKLRDRMMPRLLVYKDEKHDHRIDLSVK